MKSVRAGFWELGAFVALLSGVRIAQAAPEPQRESVAPPLQQSNPSPEPRASPTLSVHPGAYVWYAVPIEPSTPHRLEVFYALLEIDASYRHFGFRLEPRLRDTRLREYYPSNLWIQEAYLYALLSPSAKLKIGKQYTRSGLFWDGTFANLQFFDGLKLSPDYGASVEGVSPLSERLRGKWTAQYFVVDGVTNGSLNGRDTVSMPGARKRDEMILRLAPEWIWAADQTLEFGASAQVFRADFQGARDQWVRRFAADLTARLGPYVRVLAEIQHQTGRAVRNFQTEQGPGPGAPYSSRLVQYALLTAELIVGDFVVRGSVSAAFYESQNAREWFWHPGATYAFDPHFKLMSEVIYWTREDRAGTSVVSAGLHLIANLRY